MDTTISLDALVAALRSQGADLLYQVAARQAAVNTLAAENATLKARISELEKPRNADGL